MVDKFRLLPADEAQPEAVCLRCGVKYGRRVDNDHVCTMWHGTCGVCGEQKGVTSPRDFGWLKPEWKQCTNPTSA